MNASFRLFAILGLAAVTGGSLAAETAHPLYYQDPSGKPFYSATPRKDASGRDYIPVHTDPDTKPAEPPGAPPGGGKGRILYYRNPMGLPDTSPVPKKDGMGMDYLPVYEAEAAESAAGTVKISLDKVQKLGVRTEPAAMRRMVRQIRAFGTVTLDERRVSVVAPKFEGWIETLRVDATGQEVRRGQALLEVYSPDLTLAEQEYLVARDALKAMANADSVIRGQAEAVAEAALTRLRNWDISPDQLARLRRDGTARHTLTLRAPTGGLVLEKIAVAGMHFGSGDALYRIADLSSVWVVANVFEQDLAAVQPGQTAGISVAAYPERRFAGKVAFVYPGVERETRTARVRIEIPNPAQLLKTDMYATVELASPAGGAVLAVPDSAVLDNGTRQVVLVERGEGRFQPREVKLGRRAEGYAEVAGGLAAGEKVVTGANFLIDAESNLRAALQGFTAPAGQPQ